MFVDLKQLENSMDSPLRLRLMAELSQSGAAMSVEEAVLASGCHGQDVESCLRPMIAWGIMECSDDVGYQLRSDLSVEVLHTLRRIIKKKEAYLNQARYVRSEIFAGMIGTDPKMLLIFETLRQIARLDVSVLIGGETGTGKELVAQAIHNLGPQHSEHFGVVNCATISHDLFSSEIFGHVRGAFTGAVGDRVGLIEQCDKGTLFLDEIGELSLENQARFLRVLQEGTFCRVGEVKSRHSRFRLVSATNRDLSAMVSAGTFREDLFYRLNVFPIRLPSLRERLGDIPYLVKEFLAKHAAKLALESLPHFTEAALERLRQYRWPGNIRELENVVVRAAIAARGNESIDSEHLDIVLGTPSLDTRQASEQNPELASLPTVEAHHILRVLTAVQWNMSASAKILGISRTTLYKKVLRYGLGLEPPSCAKAGPGSHSSWD